MNRETQIKITDKVVADIRYEGYVTIKYNYKNQLINKNFKNSGQQALFTCLSKMLAGYDVINELPSKLIGYNGNASIFSQPIPAEQTPNLYQDDSGVGSDGNSNTVEYTFRIPFAYITNYELNKLQLINNMNNVCAEVEINPSLAIPANTNLLVYWKLKFTNQGV